MEHTANYHLYMESKITPIVEVVKMTNLKWYDHVTRREDDFTTKVTLIMKITGIERMIFLWTV